MGALEAQVRQLGLQAAQDCERLAKDRTLTLQLLHKVGLSLSMSADSDNSASGFNQYVLSLLGAGEVVCPGEEVPHFDRREDLPETHQQHERGERPHVRRHVTA